MNKRNISYRELMIKAGSIADTIVRIWAQETHSNGPKLWGVPRGGVYAAMMVQTAMSERNLPCEMTTDASQADFIIDDLIDSGATCDHYVKAYPTTAFFALMNKTVHDEWLVFPWELSEQGKDEGIESNVRRILEYVGENADRQGLLETPHRVAKAWEFWASGYSVDVKSLLKVFEDGAEGYDEMVIVKDIPIYSKCEHHLADIFGTCTIAYIPNGKVVGLSKLSRLADAFARRLQVQERLTAQIADALWEHLDPVGVGVIIKARHMCMESRGICQQGHHTITSALRGAIKEDAIVRSEFLSLAK